jgi:hypothetical protein
MKNFKIIMTYVLGAVVGAGTMFALACGFMLFCAYATNWGYL